MRTKTLLSISLLSFAAVASACSRHKVAAAPTPNNNAAAERAATEAAQRENAQLRGSESSATDDAERTARTRAADRAAITTPVYFAFDRSDITDEGLQTLDQKVDALQRNSSVRVRIEGNADDSGSDEYNLALSQRRAAVAHRYLTDRGIDASRLTVVSYGEERPACTVSREEDCRSKNRRDEFVILSGM
ncbi:MAG TPA: OmpA family protein [Gemmatimonadaceae bacterium]|nr:OmpA family protein [Gemmatimonadaceae bacterium]